MVSRCSNILNHDGYCLSWLCVTLGLEFNGPKCLLFNISLTFKSIDHHSDVVSMIIGSLFGDYHAEKRGVKDIYDIF